MKRTLIALICGLALSATLHAQTGITMTGKSSSKVVLTWTLPTPTTSWAGCGTGQPSCTFRPFELPGSCPTPVIGSTGWNQLADTGSGATTATDITPLPNASGQASYVVKTIQGGLASDPSNCTTVTVPNGPSPATGLGATAS